MTDDGLPSFEIDAADIDPVIGPMLEVVEGGVIPASQFTTGDGPEEWQPVTFEYPPRKDFAGRN